MNKVNFFLFLFILMSLQLSAKKYALIIAISTYDPITKWNPLSSDKDIPLIKGALLKKGFEEQDITIIQDEKATKAGILAAIENLKSKISKGDIVVIHYSGHGQQILDDNGDEADGLDESLVPYDAWKKYNVKYKGENHLRDDEIQKFVFAFRNTLGKDGQLLMILDSCHSGNATRGPVMRGGESALVPEGWKPPTNNTIREGSGLFETVALNTDAAPFVVISGASDSEPNFEYDGVGSLSYAFSKAMNEIDGDYSYRKLFSKIASTMNAIVPQQRPTIEGNIDYQLFEKKFIEQKPYFDVLNINQSSTVLTINGGQVNQIFPGTTVLVLPSGTESPDPKKAISTGKITYSTFADGTVTLDKPLKETNPKNYWVFVDKPSYGDFAVNVFIDPKIKDATVKTSVSTFLANNNLGKIVDAAKQSDVSVEEHQGKYQLVSSSSTLDSKAFAEASLSRGNTILEDLNEKIFRFAQGNYLKKLNINNPAYAFDFKMIPVDFDASTRKISERPQHSNQNSDGILQIVPKQDFALLEITNNSRRPLYISIVEINSEGAVSSFFPNKKCNLTDSERKLEPGQKHIYDRCLYSFSPPYERLILKAFASDRPLNFQSTVSTRGGNNDTNNPLEKFLQSSYVKTRGGDGEEISGDLDGYSTEVVYDIVQAK